MCKTTAQIRKYRRQTRLVILSFLSNILRNNYQSKFGRLTSGNRWLSKTAQRATVALVALNDKDETVASGSAFIVELPRKGPGLNHDYVLVTARHVVQQSLVQGLKIAIIVPLLRQKKIPDVVRTETVTICSGSWVHGESDVSVAKLAINDLPPDHDLRCVNRLSFADMNSDGPGGGGSDVILFGRWGVGKDHNIIVERRGILAAEEVPLVTIIIEPKTHSPNHVFLVEATVSPGMSGGPVLVMSRSDRSNGAIIGLIHGYQRLHEQGLRLDHNSTYTVEEIAMRNRLISEISSINGRIVYVIPIPAILDTLCEYQKKYALDPTFH